MTKFALFKCREWSRLPLATEYGFIYSEEKREPKQAPNLKQKQSR